MSKSGNQNNNNPKKKNANTSNNDEVFAKLTDMFGDGISAETILTVCKTYKWKLNQCIEYLIQCPEETQLNLNRNPNTISNEFENLTVTIADLPGINYDNADVVIESEVLDQIPIERPPSIPTIAPIKEEKKLGAIKKQPMKSREPIDYSFPQPPQQQQQQQQQQLQNQQQQQQLQNYNNNPQLFQQNVRINNNPKDFYLPPLCQNFDKVVHIANQGIKIMVILRGPPGSGKSYLGREIINKTVNGDYPNHIFSADDYFLNERGQYNYVPDRIKNAHEFNQNRVRKKCEEGWSPIIVDNTHIKIWEMFPYCYFAVQNGYFIEICEPVTPWSRSPAKLAMKNTHGVPRNVIENMIQNYENINCFNLLKSIKCERHMNSQPQQRIYPLEIQRKFEENIFLEALKTQRIQQSDPVQEVVNSEFHMHEKEKINFWAPIEPINDPTKSEWESYEKEKIKFWQIEPTTKGQTQRAPKPQRVEKPNIPPIVTNIYTVLPDESENLPDEEAITEEIPEEQQASPVILEQHKFGCCNENSSFSGIRQIYPSVPVEYLWDLFVTCQGDGVWTMDILLKEEAKIVEFMQTQGTATQLKNDFTCECEGGAGETTVFSDLICLEEEFIESTTPTSTISRQKKEKLQPTEDQLNTKRMIEENIILNEDHYSNHTRKIRDSRRGIPLQLQTQQLFETGACALPMTPEFNANQFIDGENSSEDNDGLIEINLGTELVNQLESIFGFDGFSSIPINTLKTNVFMPKLLAKQMFALMMESVYNQLEEQKNQTLKEDEEFARALEAQQSYPLLTQPEQPTTLKEIMDMEYAIAAYKSTVMDDWKNYTPQDLASRLSRQKLYDIFPNLEKELLDQVLAAHDNKFVETVDVLKDSLKGSFDDKMIAEEMGLFEQAREETEKTEQFQTVRLTNEERYLAAKKLGPEEAKKTALKDFEECRNLAMHHSQLKTECYSKANQAIQKGEAAVANYYSQIADLHRKKIDMYNHKAANSMVEVHNLTQNNPDMVDLHYLHVHEAITCLDIFLDRHIMKIKTSPKQNKNVMIITGRGLHSAGGIPTIKLNVKQRLRDRGLRSSEVNPGLLKVRIFANSKLSQIV